MEDIDNLLSIAQKLSASQLKQLLRYAEFIAQDEVPGELHQQSDVRARYAEFRQFCEAHKVDLAAVEAWAQATTGQIKDAG
jgi:hypothetical protein